MQEYTEALLRGIFNGTIKPRNLPPLLYYNIADYLKRALYEGYGFSISSLIEELNTGSSKMNVADLELLQELRTNIYMFSAAKTYQQVRELSSLLTDENGTVIPYSEFKKKALPVVHIYNETWMKTEYETAIGQAQNAVKWKQIEKQAEILPLLKYDAILDKNTSEICRPLDGLIAPVNDPIWRKIMPLNHFNCRCLVKQLQEGEEPVTGDKKKQELFKQSTEQMQDVFKMNPGLDGYVFKPDHPYFQVPKKDAAFAANNFGLPIPATDNAKQSELKFFEAKNLKEAEQYAKEVLGCKYANFKGVNLDIANDMNRGLFNTKVFMPELPVHGIGSAQECNKAIKEDVKDAFRKTNLYRTYTEKYGKEFAEKRAESSANGYVSKVQKNVLAWSQTKGEVSVFGEKVDLSKYKGVFVNATNAKSKAVIDEIVIKNAEKGWFTKGAKDFSYIMNHELGHEIDKLLNFRKDEDFLAIYNREHKAGINQLAEKLSTYGATAGNKIAHRPAEMIAEAWAEFTTSATPRPLAMEIGELMLRKYYIDYKQGTGTTFEKWKNETLKSIRK